MADIIQIRRDTVDNWTSVNPVLANGEQGLETDTLKTKWGNGVDAWSVLPYSAEVNTIDSKTAGEPSGSDVVLNVVSLTQAEYDAGTPVATTFYIITT